MKLDIPFDVAIPNQNTSMVRLFQGPTNGKICQNCRHSNNKSKHIMFRFFKGPTNHKIGLNYKHSNTKPKHMV
jgi:hypothetical protein